MALAQTSSARLVLLLLALACFGLVTLGVAVTTLNLLALGLFFYVLTALVT